VEKIFFSRLWPRSSFEEGPNPPTLFLWSIRHPRGSSSFKFLVPMSTPRLLNCLSPYLRPAQMGVFSPTVGLVPSPDP